MYVDSLESVKDAASRMGNVGCEPETSIDADGTKVMLLEDEADDGSNSIYLLSLEESPNTVELIVEIAGGVSGICTIINDGEFCTNWREDVNNELRSSMEKAAEHDIAFLEAAIEYFNK